MEKPQIQKEITSLHEEIQAMQKTLIELKKMRNGEEVQNYTFKDVNGKNVQFFDLFADKDELLIIHNMGKSCVYCTLWADGFRGFAEHLSNRVNWALVSPDEHSTMAEFASSRNWNYPVLSSNGNSFKKDMGFENEEGAVYPGYSTFEKRDGKVYHTAFDWFGPGDLYAPIWHMLDMLPKGQNKWAPKYIYS